MDYFGLPYASNSLLTKIKNGISPSDKFPPTEAYAFGSLVDALITEPHKVNYASGLVAGIQLSGAQIDTAKRMRDNFFRDPICKNLFDISDKQKELVIENMIFEFEGFEFEIGFKCKYDLFLRSAWYGVDIKTTAAKTQKQFEESVFQFDWDRQGALYMDIPTQLTGEESKQFLIIGISKKIPHKIFKLPIKRDDGWYKSGKSKYTELAFKLYQLL